MTGLIIRGREGELIIPTAFEMADYFMEGRKPEEGIAAIKKARKKHVQES